MLSKGLVNVLLVIVNIWRIKLKLTLERFGRGGGRLPSTSFSARNDLSKTY